MAVVAIIPTPGTYDFNIYQGAHFERVIQGFVPTGLGQTEIDLDGHTATMQIRPTRDAPALLLEFSTANGRITIANDKVTLILTPEETLFIDWEAPAFYDLALTSPDGETFRVLEGRVRFIKSVTR